MNTVPTTFWDDLAEELKDPEFLRAYLAESSVIEARELLARGLDLKQRGGTP